MTKKRIIIYGKSYRRLNDLKLATSLAALLGLGKLPVLATDENILNCLRGSRYAVVFITDDAVPHPEARAAIDYSYATPVALRENFPTKDLQHAYSFQTRTNKNLSVDELIELINAPS